MVKHRGLNLQKFIAALPWDLFEAYFNQLDVLTKPGAWAWLNPGKLFEFLCDEGNAEATSVILEDFQRVNDLGFFSSYLLMACSRAGVNWSDKESGQAAAMRLFLTDREAFEYGWTLYVLQTTTLRRSEYYFPAGPLAPGREQTEKLCAHLGGFFSAIKRGEQCRVSLFKDGAKLYLRVARGKQLVTYARWKGNEVTFETFRPAWEDVLIYDSEKSLLGLFGGSKRDRERYIEAFSEYIAERKELAQTALNSLVFTLKPFQDGSFSYAGTLAIRRITLLEIDFVDIHGTIQTFKGPYIFASLASQNLTLDSIDLKKVKLLFEIRTEGEKRASDIPVTIEPPVSSDFAQKYHADLIESYLKQQGVKLL